MRQPDQFGQLFSGKRLGFRCALDFNELARSGQNEIGVGIGFAVFEVIEIEHGGAAIDAARDRSHVVADRISFEERALLHPADRFGQRNESAGDRSGAGAAIGFDNVAIQNYLVFAQRAHVDDGAQRAPDQALDFLGAARLLAGRRLAAGARAGGARQHAVFRCHPSRPCPRRQGGSEVSTLAVHRTRVRPNATRHEPSACGATPRSIVTSRI
mgnify:CR=1 FL=1